MEKKGWKITAIIFIVLFALAFLFGYWMIKIEQSNVESNSKQAEYYNTNYEFKCQEGTTRQCIPNGKTFSYCDEGDYTLCYDSTVQSGTVCNKLDNVDAVCMPRGANWIKCPISAYVRCYDYTTGLWVSSI